MWPSDGDGCGAGARRGKPRHEKNGDPRVAVFARRVVRPALPNAGSGAKAQGVHSMATPLKSTALFGVLIDRLLMWRNAKPARQWPSALLTPTPKWSENWKLLP